VIKRTVRNVSSPLPLVSGQGFGAVMLRGAFFLSPSGGLAGNNTSTGFVCPSALQRGRAFFR
jgi:hypothetical protein